MRDFADRTSPYRCRLCESFTSALQDLLAKRWNIDLQKSRYNINNVAIAGTLYLTNGLGNLVGARIAGRKSALHNFITPVLKFNTYRVD